MLLHISTMISLSCIDLVFLLSNKRRSDVNVAGWVSELFKLQASFKTSVIVRINVDDETILKNQLSAPMLFIGKFTG